MLNTYQDEFDSISGVKNLPKAIVRAAFCRMYPTRIQMQGLDGAAALVNIKDYRFLKSVEQLAKALNEKTNGDLTVPDFIANALDSCPDISVKTDSIRAKSESRMLYKPSESRHDQGKPSEQNVKAAINRETRSVVYGLKPVSPVDQRKPRAVIVNFDDHVLLEAIRDAFKESTDRNTRLLHRDWQEFELKIAEVMLHEFARVSDQAISSELVENFNPSDEYQRFNYFHRSVGLLKVRNKDEFIPEAA